MSKAASLLRPYNFSVWIPLLLALVIAGPVLWFVAGKSRKTNLKQPLSLWHSYRINFLIIISQGDTSFERIILVFVNPTDLFNNYTYFLCTEAGHLPRSFAISSFLILWCFSSIVIYSGEYAANKLQ